MAAGSRGSSRRDLKVLFPRILEGEGALGETGGSRKGSALELEDISLLNGSMETVQLGGDDDVST